MFVKGVLDINHCLKKLLITLRHPGPSSAICSVMEHLVKEFDVYLVISDAAIPFIKERHSWILEKTKVYIPAAAQTIEFIPYTDQESQVSCEFKSSDYRSINEVKDALCILLNQIRPDIILRTTPAYDIGIDEIIFTAAKQLRLPVTLKCYQESVGVGKCFMNNEHEIASAGCIDAAVISREAEDLFFLKEIKTILVGDVLGDCWYARNDFSENRQKARDKLDIDLKDYCVLYVASKIDDECAEHLLFQVFLSSMVQAEGIDHIFLKFHPRHTELDKEQYYKICKEANLKIIDIYKLEYIECLAVANLIISIASNMNIEAIQYSASSKTGMLSENDIASGYLYGPAVRKIIQDSCGVPYLPIHKQGNIHYILSDQGFAGKMKEIVKHQRDCKEKRIREVSDNGDTSVQNLLMYIKQKQ